MEHGDLPLQGMRRQVSVTSHPTAQNALVIQELGKPIEGAKPWNRPIQTAWIFSDFLEPPLVFVSPYRLWYRKICAWLRLLSIIGIPSSGFRSVIWRRGGAAGPRLANVELETLEWDRLTRHQGWPWELSFFKNESPMWRPGNRAPVARSICWRRHLFRDPEQGGHWPVPTDGVDRHHGNLGSITPLRSNRPKSLSDKRN